MQGRLPELRDDFAKLFGLADLATTFRRGSVMDRRNFVRLGAAAGTLALSGAPLAAEPIASEAEAAARRSRPFSPAPFALEETTLADLQSGMASGKMTAHSITQDYINRIHELDRIGPTLRHIGPGVSWLCAIGMMPDRLARPSVGLMPTSEQLFDGETIEPSVSVPIASAQRFADTAPPDPELDPHGFRSSTYGFLA